MDSITHTLFGLTLYAAIDKQSMEKPLLRAIGFTAVAGSLAPDIDVISSLWDTQGLYQMWHRGITHSIFAVPVFAVILWLICYLIWRTKDRRIFAVGLLAVFIHSTSDLFNAWGTGYLEPFSAVRVTFGVIPIVDFVVWVFILGGFLIAKIKKIKSPFLFRMVGLLIVCHVALQSVQGWLIYRDAIHQYERVTLSASFVPGQYAVIGQNGAIVDMYTANVWSRSDVQMRFESNLNADLDYLFRNNPEARTLYQWSPIVVIEETPEEIRLFDPRFYRNGESFLMESASK
jgi:inner membrane protein